MSAGWPSELRANAWDGKRPAVLRQLTQPDAFLHQTRLREVLAPPPLVPDRDWRSSGVGWGLVLPDIDNLPAADKAAGADAPAPLRRLLAHRANAPVLRYRPELRTGILRRYYPNGRCENLETAAPRYGTGHGRIPRYLLIYASPVEIPWSVQYALNLSTFVGRLDLSVEEGLEHYVAALIDDWDEAEAAEPAQPLIWSADHGLPDITWLMARVIGGKLKERFDADEELRAATWLQGPEATCQALVDGLLAKRPGLVCTTSHGMTGPRDDPEATIATLGAPVDTALRTLTVSQLAAWAPAGAIWYAHACCSAGSDSASRYAGLVAEDSDLGALLRAVSAAAGARVAPLPRALLGRPRPLRAFVGHVEPTFDWTLRDPVTKQVLTHTIVECLYRRLYQADGRSPLGWALAPLFAEAGAFLGSAPAAAVQPAGPDTDLFYRRLVGMDRQSLVILGDPTVSLRRLSR